MPECEGCGSDLPQSVTCALETVVIDGMDHLRVRLGAEWPLREHPEQCPHCGTPNGGVHHVRCEREQCPLCREPLASCECRKDPPFQPVRPAGRAWWRLWAR